MKKLYSLIALILFLSVVLVHAQINNIPHYYTLEIIQPQAGLDTKNAFYKAYPGIEYNRKVSVIGGVYPFTYSLTVNPAGMVIDQNTGVIKWPNPITTGSPFSVTAQVTDQANNTATKSWTVTVTTTGWLFVDSTNGHRSACNTAFPGGTAAGTISDPFKGTSDWYCGNVSGKHDTTYANYFVIYRAGTYPNEAPNTAAIGQLQYNAVTATTGKPVVHIGYPGETVNFDMSIGGWNCDVSCTNAYFDNINLVNFTMIYNAPHGLSFADGGNVTVRRMTCSHIPATSGSNNQSCFFFGRVSIVPQYESITENTFTDIQDAYAVLGYASNKVLVADNTLSNFGDPLGAGASHAMDAKDGCSMWFIRNNNLSAISGDALESLYGNTTANGNTTDIEYSFNLVKSTGGNGLNVNQDGVPTGGPIYVFRNTFVGGSTFFIQVGGSNGPFYFYNNVALNQNGIQCISCSSPGRLVTSNNILALSSSGVTDASGNLTGLTPCGNLPNACSSYVGVIGYQTGTPQAAPPKAPANFQIVPGP